MKAHKLMFFAVAACAIGFLIGPSEAQDKNVKQQKIPAAGMFPIQGELPSLSGAIEWLNSPPLTAAGLRGKVVLVEFWTYTCINWRRTLPYVRAWAAKYKAQGLVVIGVHTPEFSFEKNVDNVRQAESTSQSRSTASMRYGALSIISTGLRYILSTRTDMFAITNSARANTNSPRRSFNSC